MLRVILAAYGLYLSPVFFVGEFRTGEECLPEGLKERTHDDFPGPLKALKRKHNVFCGVQPPKKVWGNTDHREWQSRPKPVPLFGDSTLAQAQLPTKAWNIMLLTFAYTSKNGWHFRLGQFRWDDVDDYYTFPTFTVKRIQPNWEAVLYYRFICSANQKAVTLSGDRLFNILLYYLTDNGPELKIYF
jgi:hypothetical protein